METPEVIEARIAQILKDGAKNARKREVWLTVLVAASATGAIFMWEILFRGARAMAALF